MKMNNPLIGSSSKRWYQYYTFENFFRKANVATTPSGKDGLKKCLTLFDLIAFGVGSTVGSGIFVTVGSIIQVAGPGALISFLFAAFASLLSAFCYAEFATRIPVSGSAYTFAYVTMGESIGWLIGWNLTLEYAISASVVARSWAGYLQQIFTVFGVSTPDELFNYPVNDYISFSPISISIVVICTIVLLFGAKDSSYMNIGLTCLNIAILCLIIVVAGTQVDMKNWDPFLPHQLKGAFAGAGVAFFSFIGFDSVTTLSEEVKNPQRDLPIGIVGTLAIASVMYVGVTLTLTGMINYLVIGRDDQQNFVDAPLSVAFTLAGFDWTAKLVAVVTVISLSATTLCSLLGQPRIFFTMAKDGLLPAKFCEVNSNQVPVFGTIVTGVCAAVIACLFDLSVLTKMISIGTLLAFTIVCAGIIVIRKKSAVQPYHTPIALLSFAVISFVFSFTIAEDWPRATSVVFGVLLLMNYAFIHLQPTTNMPPSFQCPFVPAIPCIAIYFNIYLIVRLSTDAIIRGAIWSLIGLAIYMAYGIRHSRLNEENRTDVVEVATGDSDYE